MTEPCRSEPISFLRLERYLQGDVDTLEQRRVSEHLRECATCRACFESLCEDLAPLPALPAALPATPERPQPPLSAAAGGPQLATSEPLRLPLSAAGRQPRRSQPWAAVRWTAVAALAAVTLLWVRAPSDAPSTPSVTRRVKGSDLALELVREHAGSIAFDSGRFAPGDRFAARLTCPAGHSVYAELVVFQAGETFFPFEPMGPVPCANGVTLPAAFTLDGSAPVEVCVVTDETGPIDRARLSEHERVRTLTAACCKLLEVDTP